MAFATRMGTSLLSLGRRGCRLHNGVGEMAHNVAGGLGVEGDVVCARLGEILDDRIHRRHHQVHVDRRLDPIVLEGLAHLQEEPYELEQGPPEWACRSTRPGKGGAGARIGGERTIGPMVRLGT